MDTVPAGPGSVSHYRLLSKIGAGGMGEVWLAEDTQLPRKVAVKLLPRDAARDPQAVARLLREAQAAATIDHPAVVTVYEAGVSSGAPYLVMQRVEGETLSERLTRGPLTVAEAVTLAERVADALAEVHALGIVHRDLKPSNIILGPRGPKVVDFGVASLKGAAELTIPGTIIGTPLTMSPEQVKGWPADNRSDLWALGVVLYAALTGREPFTGQTPVDVGYSVVASQPPPPSSFRPEVTPALDQVVIKLLRKDPAERYGRAEDLLADLHACQAELNSAPSAQAKPTVPRVAVLYFEVLGSSPDDGFLAAGLTDDLIVDLTRLGGMRVASREDVRVYRDRAVPPRTLGRELDVDYILLGSVRRAGNRIRVAAQLVRASDGQALWADRLDRTVEDLFGLQTEVSHRIVEALQVALQPGEREMLERVPSKSTEAYTFYLKARELLDKGTGEENRRAEQMLRLAVELDPGFALAHAALGECYAVRALKWWGGREVVEPALACSKRALEIEPDLLDAHLARAIALRVKEDPDALEALDHVIRLDPDHAEALTWAAFVYMTLGKPERAAGILERVLERHPRHYRAASYLTAAYDMLGRSDEAVRSLDRSIDACVEQLRHNPDDALARAFLAIALVHGGQLERGIEQAERAVGIAPEDGRIRYNVACAFARAGLVDRALEQLREGIRRTPGYFHSWAPRDPDFGPLRGNPEFIRLFSP
jgi:serine/threonine protein kinase/Tfp pilus assembly protein PilF